VDKPADKLVESIESDDSQPKSAADLFVGRTIQGKYEVLEKIGEGGMGVVYRARHIHLHRDFAIKFLLPTGPYGFDEQQLGRFQREAREASGLHHQNLVSIIDFGTTDDAMPFLVMDLVEGETVSEMISKNGPVAVEDAVEISGQICDAMQYAHSKGVIHRDLKPSNVMVSRNGGGFTVHVLDFGVAKFNTQAEDAALKTLTATGEIVGSPAYMSPEQAMGYKLDARSDIYSMGCIIFEMLAGRPVFRGDSAMAIVVKHLNDAPPALRDIPEGRHVKPELAKIVRQTLEKQPGSRYQTVADLQHDIARVKEGKAPEREFASGRAERDKLIKRGTRLGIAAVVTLCAGLALTLIVLLTQTANVPEWKRSFQQAQFEKGERSFDLYHLALRKAQGSGATLPQILNEQDMLMRTYNDRDQAKATLSVGNEALKLAAGKGDITELARVYDQMAEAKLISKDYPNAIVYAKQAADMKRRMHEPALYVAHSLGRLAQAYRQHGSAASAEQTNLQALKVLEEAHLNVPHRANIYLQLSNLYFDQNNGQKSIESIQKAIEVSEQTRGAKDVETERLRDRLAVLNQHFGKGR
jgi:tetratricopeptide (TPR) repeat protein